MNCHSLGWSTKPEPVTYLSRDISHAVGTSQSLHMLSSLAGTGASKASKCFLRLGSMTVIQHLLQPCELFLILHKAQLLSGVQIAIHVSSLSLLWINLTVPA